MGLLTVILILAIVSIPSTSFSSLINDKSVAAVDNNQLVLYTPAPTATQGPKKPQISTVESISHSPEIKVYEKNSTHELTGISWGSISIGQAKYYDIEVANIGNQPVTLQLAAINWTPGIDASIKWFYNETALQAGSTIPITLCLTVNSATTNTFGNDIVISSTNA